MSKMKRPRRIVVIRHAESDRNAAKGQSVYFTDDEARKNIKGIPDHLVGITPLGWHQVRQTGPSLRARFGVPHYIYHSGYNRTIQTKDGILEAYTPDEIAKIKIRENLFIRERNPGYAYDMTQAEVNVAFPWLNEHWETWGGFLAQPPGGESLVKVAERVYLFLNMLFRDRAGQDIFVVTHGGVIRLLRYLLERWNYAKAEKWAPGESPQNCGVTVYEYDPV